MNFYYPKYNRSCYKDTCNTMTVQGKASVYARPDMATINIGVSTESKDAQLAQRENAVKSNKVVNDIKKLGIKEEDIRTISYSIDRKYEFIDNKQEFVGYEVRNIFRVTIRDLDLIGKVIDVSVQNGANIVDSINFSLSKPDIYYKKALNEAAQDAKSKAREIARAFEVQLNRTPISITEQSFGISRQETYSLKLASDTTHIEAGQLEIVASMSVIFSYS
ncbi:SIMPL domain-containing protein [Alkalithermobacter paradoxus]|uniref:26 kDa periplasmic immunogenic protein n=1 Tax=Alkalithermobacter paradoxus TaxID=29349 RepID=A0A1V4IBM8_9FIRM|nr:26 kDa periplasmic immunogenic protein precursor [[Clostridium] thermoalcaliphilum]